MQLTEAFNDVAIKDIALLVIDVQRDFCNTQYNGTPETEKLADEVSRWVPAFRDMGVSIYAIRLGYTGQTAKEFEFYKFEPAAGDIEIVKNSNSAFDTSNIKDLLRADGKKHLIACGVNLSACVRATVMDARRHWFDVTLLTDLTCNGKGFGNYSAEHLDDMRKRWVTFETAEDMLQKISAKTGTCPPPVLRAPSIQSTRL